MIDIELQVTHIVYHFFFFSSRRRHTRLQGDWSSDVCSSDLLRSFPHARSITPAGTAPAGGVWAGSGGPRPRSGPARPEDRERGVEGKRGDLGGRRIIKKKKKKKIQAGEE